jgi:2-polyprenyl-3-methyl-5-hydroxy-6-metoxy-1,4-benzoquinol methylase
MSLATASGREPGSERFSRTSSRYEASGAMREYKYDRTRILLDWVGTKKRVLEVGCSTGYISRLLVERKCDVTGVEVDPVAAERARAHCKDVFVLDLNSPSWLESLSDRRYEVVLLADVLEHLVDPWRVLREIAGLLEGGGSLVVSLPNLVYLVTRAKIALGEFNYTSTGILDHTHLRFFTLKTARDLIESSGYRITRFRAAVGGGRLNARVRLVLELFARFAPGVFAYQMLFEAKRS